MARISKRLYTSVAANDTESIAYTVPSGNTLEIYSFGGDGAVDVEVKVEIKFDTEVFFATHTSDNQSPTIPLKYTGDGSKQVVIRLVNDSSIQETIGAWWEGFLVE